MQRVILVGCGFMGRMHDSVYSRLANADVVALVDHHPQRGEELAKGRPLYRDLRTALRESEADVVDICLPTYLHREFADEAASAGKHVFCEKPMALNLADADAMIGSCATSGVRLMIGHCIRFWPEYEILKGLIDGGRFGHLRSLNLTRYGQFPSWSSDNWLADERKSGGGALDMHIHDTDFALHALGEPSEMASWGTVDARGVSQIMTTMAFPGGSVAHLEGGWNLPPGTPFKMTFRAIFERGAAIVEDGPLTLYPEDGQPEMPEMEKLSAEGGGNISDLGGYFRELEYFIDCLQTGAPLDRCTPESARRSLAVCLDEISQVKERLAVIG